MGQVFTVKSYEVPEYREHFEPVLKAIERRTKLVTAADVLDQSESGDAQLWGYAQDGQVLFAAATRILEMAQGKLCTIWVGAGSGTPEVFRDVHDAIEAWARSMGCFALEIVGRKGWQRIVDGYSTEAVVMAKPLGRVN